MALAGDVLNCEAAMYPIADFIRVTMTEQGLTRGKLATAMGYRNASKALRRLDELLQGGQAAPEFLTRLTAALTVDPATLEAAMEATRAVQREEACRQYEADIAAARLAFRPHLRVIPERSVPQPIFVAALTGTKRWLVEPLPKDILSMPIAQSLLIVGQHARDHYARTNGRAGPFGAIRGYLFRVEFEKAIRLDVEGAVQGEQNGRIPEGRAILRLK
jgi:hypothetical protein